MMPLFGILRNLRLMCLSSGTKPFQVYFLSPNISQSSTLVKIAKLLLENLVSTYHCLHQKDPSKLFFE